MKIIISHDVDHLMTSDHYFKDLIVEKFIVRAFLHFLKRKISFHTFLCRLGIVFTNRMNNIASLTAFDKKHGIPSTFFFGMKNGLGMSYSVKRATPFIQKVQQSGFDVGVHGIEYQSIDGIKIEHDLFQGIVGDITFGIRNHYVRFDKDTFAKMDEAGYLFDSTQFNKKTVELINPYKINHMWEFPLHVMDTYVCKEGDYKKDLEKTLHVVEEAEKTGIKFLTILFHDDGFNENTFPEEYKWYVALVESLLARGFLFSSFRDAIGELEENGRN